ncbi:MAG: T9SS type A sorting domain-containing protein [Bacteroidetes bacterium]|nr:T9SS type A sorting domain-containing protein [Bacteroidota bacterium]
MNTKLTVIAIMLLGTWMLTTSSMRDPNNPPTGNTGAPNETTCQQSSCHTGGSYTGSVTITGIPDTVVANQSYTVTLKQTSNAVRGGFQLTSLDAGNAFVGTLTAGTGVNIGTGSNSRKYARQSTPKTLANGSTSWSFTWKAPSSANNNTVKFYFVSLAANGNGNKTGDNVLTGEKTVLLAQPVASQEPSLADKIKVYPIPANDVLRFNLGEASNAKLTLFNLNGQQVLQTNIQSGEAVPVQSLLAGRYVAQLSIGREVASKQVLIVR